MTIIKLIIMMLIKLIFLLLIAFTPNLFFLLLILLILDVIEYLLEKKAVRLNLVRFILFLIMCLITLFFSTDSRLNHAFQPLSFIQNAIGYYSQIIDLSISGRNVLVILTGLFFLFNEANFLVRLVFEMTGKMPVSKETRETDKTELNAGRVIGILERFIIFFFVTIGQFAAVGFVIAAKSIVRYKELEDRNFAEYVLIGTLLSSLLAIVTGFAAARLLM